MAMAKLYYKRVIADLMKINEVPTKWRKQVQDMIDTTE